MRISNRFSRSMLFEDGIPTIFEENGKKGIKMGNGERIELKKKLCEFEYTSCKNYMLLRQGDKYGLWSEDTQLLPTIYDEIATPIDDWGIRVKKNGEWGYLDKNNNFQQIFQKFH